MADISKITLPTGTTYDIADAQARADIEDLQSSLTGGMHYKGITTTPLSDGATTSTIKIDGENVSFTTDDAGSVVIYGDLEFVWNGSKWQEFGSTGSLKALAFKDSASGDFTPDGSVSQPTFTGTSKSISVTGTTSGSVAISKGTGTANYTPEGSVSTPTITVTPNTGTVNSITNVGSLPSCTMPSCTLPTLTTNVVNENLTISWSAGSYTDGSYTQGTLPTKGADVTVVTGIKSATSTQPSFTGTGAELKATFTGSEITSTGTYKPEGTVSKPTFTGTQGTVTVS